MNYLVVALDRIPWGHLNVVDLGTAGYRVIAPGTLALTCAEIAIGDKVEIDGRNVYRAGTVAEKGQNLYPVAEDGLVLPVHDRRLRADRPQETPAVRSSSAGSRPASPAGASAATSGSRRCPKGWPSSASSCARRRTAI